MNWQDDYLPISWIEFAKLSENLGQQLIKNDRQFDLIVAIARGGLAVAQILSDALSLPIASFTIQSYKDLKQQSASKITFGLGKKLKNQKVLLVDDVADSGKTFIRGISYLEKQGTKREDITTASLHYKPHSVFKPDFFVVETSKWIIYPSEIHETIKTLAGIWKQKNIAIRDIYERLLILGFSKEAITQYVR